MFGFDKMFDFNRDGKLDSWERAAQFQFMDEMMKDDEMKDFAYISKKLDEISLAIDSLNLWVDKTAGEQGLNLELLNAEKEKLK